MLKHILLASSMMVAVPAFAQETPPTEKPAEAPASPTTQEQTSPTDAAPTAPEAPSAAPADSMVQTTPPAGAPTSADQAQTMTEQAQPAQQAQATPAQPATPAQQPAQTADATTTPAQPADKATQVAAVVGKEFPAYDKDSNGNLSQNEFGAWMMALRKASEPGFDTASAEATTWVGQAFAMADTDKDSAVNQSELTGFLAKGA